MKIIQFIREIHPHGGSSGVAWNLREQFNALRIDNDVIVWRKNKRKPAHKIVEKLFLMYDIIMSTIVMTVRFSRLPKNVVIINHNDALGGDIYVDHGLHKEVVRGNKWMLLRNPLHIFMLAREQIRHSLRLYKKIVCLSSYSKYVMKKNYGDVLDPIIEVIPNGVDLKKFHSQDRQARDGGLRVIFVGHEFERKGLQCVIESLKLLPEEVILTVVGGSNADIREYTKFAISNEVSERVRFLGRRPDVQDLLMSADVMVMPSSFEAWPLVCLESMACGAPVLMTNVGGASEMIHDYSTGFTVERNPHSVAERLIELHRDRSLLEKMSRESAAFAKNYGWRVIADRYVTLARDIVADRQ